MFQSARCIAVRVFPLPPKPTHHAGNCGLVSTYSDYPQLRPALCLRNLQKSAPLQLTSSRLGRQRDPEGPIDTAGEPLGATDRPTDHASEFCGQNPQAPRQRAYPPVHLWSTPPTSDGGGVAIPLMAAFSSQTGIALTRPQEEGGDGKKKKKNKQTEIEVPMRKKNATKKGKGKGSAPNRMPAKVGAAVCDHRLARIRIQSRDSTGL